jgi:hypothetical protein
MNALSLPTIAEMLLFWIIGLYVLTRSPRTATSRLAAACLLLIALYLLGQSVAMNATIPDDYRFWSRTFWFGAAMAPTIWYWLAYRLAHRNGRTNLTGVLVGIAITALGGVALVAGTATNLLLDREAPSTLSTPFGFTQYGAHPSGLYWVYALNVVGSAAASCVMLFQAYSIEKVESLERAQVAWMLRSGLVFAVGAAYLVANVIADRGIPEQPGYLILTAGLTLVGYGIARYNALIEGQVIAADFVDFVASSLGLGALFSGVILVVTGFSSNAIPVILVVTLVALASHASADLAGSVWDRLFHRREVRLLRAELRALEGNVARSPDRVDVLIQAQEALDRVTDAHFRSLVEDALRKLNNVPALAEHPLQERVPALLQSYLIPFRGDAPVPTRFAALDRARALRQALTDAIQRLRPAGEQSSKFNPAWGHYVILHDAYEVGRQNKEIMRRYQLSEGTFNRYRRQAVAVLAADLRERAAVERNV